MYYFLLKRKRGRATSTKTNVATYYYNFCLFLKLYLSPTILKEVYRSIPWKSRHSAAYSVCPGTIF